jgi:hypothetical protein
VLQPRTLKVLAVLLAAWGLLAFSAYLGPAFLESVGWYTVVVPILSIHFFHHYGVPGLLEHGGACGWGLCSPTPLGWVFMGALWLGIAWLAAWALARTIFRGAQQ